MIIEPPEHNSERGASLVIAAITLAVMFAAGALAVDLGALWSSKRELVLATDAAALGGAAATIGGATDACDNEVENRLAANHPNSEVVDCSIVVNGPNGIAVVTATEVTDLMFAPIFGSDLAIESSTTVVEWGIPSAATGVLPIGLCAEADGLKEFLVSAPNAVPTEVILNYEKSAPDQCGGNTEPGSWGLLSLDCHLPDVAPNCNNSNANLKDWIENGNQEETFAGLAMPSPCSHHPTTGCYSGYPGSRGGSFADEYGSHLGETWLFPVYDYAAGRGSNAQFHVIGFVRARIGEYAFSGRKNPACGGLKRCLVLTFAPGLVNGSCCGDAGALDTGARTTRICGISADRRDHCHNAGLTPEGTP